MRGFLRFLTENHYVGLLTTLIWLALIGPEAEELIPAKWLSAVIMAAILVSSAFVVSKSKHDRRLAFASAAIAGVLWTIYNLGGEHTLALSLATCVVNFIYVTIICGIVIRDVFDGDVTANKLSGALCAYLLIGVGFALLYQTAAIANPHAFRFILADGTVLTNSLEMGRAQLFSSLLYHSFLTISTCGYGDIVPLSGPVRSLCWVEAIAGQTYLAVIVARLVGLHIVASSGYSDSSGAKETST